MAFRASYRYDLTVSAHSEIQQKFKMTPLAWMVATMLAALTMVATASQFFYTRNEAHLLEKRVDKLDENTSRKLERIEDKLDKIISRLPNK